MICTLTLCDISLAPTILFLDDRFNLSQYLSDGLEGKKLEGSLLSKILQDDRKLDPSSLFWDCLLMAKSPCPRVKSERKSATWEWATLGCLQNHSWQTQVHMGYWD